MIDNKEIYNLQQELSALKTKAKNIGYKNQIPTLPVSKPNNQTSFESRMCGFIKRFNNWKHGLEQLKNPGGTKKSDVFVANNGMIIHTSSDN